VSKSFKATLAAYPITPHPADDDGRVPRLSSEDSAHLKRWARDDRADEVWNTIHRAAQSHGTPPPMLVLIQETLGARELAKSMNHRRKNRKQYRERADQMVRIAKFLRAPVPYGVLLIPTAMELARGLDEAAQKCREYVAVSRNLSGLLQWTRESKPRDVFISILSHDLHGLTGRWLDHEVAVLAEIAFDEAEIDDDQVIWVRRGVKRSKPASRRAIQQS
jgi:hypothetical protein